MSNRAWEIYTLSDPRTTAVRYVGVTFRRKARMHEHISHAVRGGNTYRDRWIRSLITAGIRPFYQVIQAGQGEGWEEAERHWIAHYRLCAKLVNCTDGGEGLPGYVPTPELRQKWSAMRAGVPYAPGRVPPMRGKNHTPEAREKIRATSLGRRHTPTSKAKLSAAHTGKRLTPEHRAKLSVAHMGMRYSEEARRNMSRSRTGHKPVMCIETQEVFPSIRAASQARNVHKSCIPQAIRKGCRCQGYHWQFLLPSTTSKP